ncbi:uncharacterized protein [Dermacentor albipictus]|uniref:uncharacterized protein n=1 Tax=Dermacentor albipictus TaxID=60249 RepID=UPI0038FC270E
MHPDLKVDSYQEATVIPPKIGFYKDPVISNDFEGLYPSIMISFNLYPTTLIWPEDAQNVVMDKYKSLFADPKEMKALDASEKCLGHLHNNDPRMLSSVPPEWYEIACNRKNGMTKKIASNTRAVKEYAEFFKLNAARMRQGVAMPGGQHFMPDIGREGLVPSLLRFLVRRRIKKEVEKDAVMKIILDKKQLMVKLMSNSMYGACGISAGSGMALLPCTPLSAAVTGNGRVGLNTTVFHVLDYDPRLRVIYGGTDSFMIQTVPGTTMKEAGEIGRDCSTHNHVLPGGMNLPFEKLYYPYLLMAKKRYIGGYYTNNLEKYDKIDVKGMETVRRDACGYASFSLKETINVLIEQKSVEPTLAKAHEMLAGLWSTDPMRLVISKTLNNVTNDRLPHVRAANKIKERGEEDYPKVGDRVPYLVIATGDKRICDRADDPKYVVKNNIPMD